MPAGGLGFSVAVFTICALLCVALLVLRRKLYKGELGGDSVPKWLSASFLVILWLVYIVLSTIKAYQLASEEEDAA